MGITPGIRLNSLWLLYGSQVIIDLQAVYLFYLLLPNRERVTFALVNFVFTTTFQFPSLPLFASANGYLVEHNHIYWIFLLVKYTLYNSLSGCLIQQAKAP